MVDWIVDHNFLFIYLLLLNISFYNFRMWLHALKRAQSISFYNFRMWLHALKRAQSDNISFYNFRMWLHALKRAQSDKQLPTPRHERRNLRPEEIEELEEQRLGFYFVNLYTLSNIYCITTHIYMVY
jgi:hypothetical protein